MRHIYTSIDIGTDTIKIIVSELFHNRINLLASSSVKSKGIKKGLVVDIDEASNSLKMGVQEIETKLGVKLHDVITVIPSDFAEFHVINGSVDVTSDTITGEDIINVLQQGMNTDELNMEMVTILPINFTVNGKVVRDPKGMQASKLESKSVLVTVPSKNIYAVMKLLDKCGLEPVDISLSGICDMEALKNSELNDKIGAIVNIGSDTTTISLYNKCIIVKNEVLNIGGKTIDNDLAYVYKTNMMEAKKLKEKFALASLKYSNVSDLYDITKEDGSTTKVNQREVSEVVVARLTEILNIVKKEVVSLANRPIDYIIFTGGTSNIPYLEYLIDDIFGNVAHIAKMNIVGVRNNKYSTSLGNIVYYINKQRLKGDITSMISREEEENLSSLKKNLLNVSNESVLGKVAQYFFGE